jgi:hypothetical protein
MIKATYIKSEDLQNLQQDENGNYIIPDGIKIYIEEDPETVRLNRISYLEGQLENINEPSNEELIEEGKMMHPYYMLKEELDYLKK